MVKAGYEMSPPRLVSKYWNGVAPSFLQFNKAEKNNDR